MAAQVILELIPDVSKVKAAIDQLGDSGAVSDSSAASFKAGNAEIAKRNALLTQQASIQSKIQNTEQKEIATLGQVQKAASAVAGTVIKLSGKEFQAAMQAQSKSADQLIKSLAGVTQEETKQVQATSSLKAEKRKLTEEIARLIAAGQQESATFKEMVARAGEIDDAMKDASDAISRTGSDTRGLDNAILGARGVAAGFTVATGVAAIFGNESEEVQKVLLKVNAAMAVLNGLQEIQNILKSEYVKTLITSIAATRTQATVLTAETVATEGATVAQTGLNAAMAANPILLIVGLLGAIATAMLLFSDSTEEAKQDQEDFNNALRQANSDLNYYNLQLDKSLELEKALAEQRGATGSEIIALDVDALNKKIAKTKETAEATKQMMDDEKTSQKDRFEATKQYYELILTTIPALEQEAKLKEIQGVTAVGQERKKFTEEQKQATAKAIQDAEQLNEKYKELSATIRTFFNSLRGDSDADKVMKDFQQEVDMFLKPPEFTIFDKNAEATAQQQADNLNEILRRHLATRTQDIDKQAEKEKAIRQQLQAVAIQLTAETADAIFEVNKAKRDAELQNALNALDKEKDYALSTKNLTESQKTAIQKKYDNETRRLKNEAAKKERKAAIAQAIVNGLLAVTNALATVQPFWAALIAAAGAGIAAGVNVAKISSTPLPAYEKGTTSAAKGYALVGEKGPEIVEFGGGEKVWTATQSDKMMKEWNAANHSAVISDYRANTSGSMAIDYDQLGKAVAKYMPKGAVVHNTLDKEGYTTFIIQENHKRTIRNKTYSTR